MALLAFSATLLGHCAVWVDLRLLSVDWLSRWLLFTRWIRLPEPSEERTKLPHP